MAYYICAAGYGIDSADQIRECDGTTWSATAPECNGNVDKLYQGAFILVFFFLVIVCQALVFTTNILLVYVPDMTDPHDFGTAAIHICHRGYYLVGPLIRHCGGHGSSVNGNWDGSLSTCLSKFYTLFSYTYKAA